MAATFKGGLGRTVIGLAAMCWMGCAPIGFPVHDNHLEQLDGDLDSAENSVEAGRQVPSQYPKKDFVYRGELSPSIYFHSLIRDEPNNCQTAQWASLLGAGHVELMRVCSSTLKVCTLEGSCQISRGSQTRSFNYRGKENGKVVFFEIKSDGCLFGYGVQSACLDPFYSIAADLTVHKAGTVIYMPKAAGLLLPNGEKHSGFFVIRDRGGAIKGVHRFDFFSGTMHWQDEENPFRDIHLQDTKTKHAYFRVQGETARGFLQSRAYPKLPASPVQPLSGLPEVLGPAFEQLGTF